MPLSQQLTPQDFLNIVGAMGGAASTSVTRAVTPSSTSGVASTSGILGAAVATALTQKRAPPHASSSVLGGSMNEGYNKVWPNSPASTTRFSGCMRTCLSTEIGPWSGRSLAIGGHGQFDTISAAAASLVHISRAGRSLRPRENDADRMGLLFAAASALGKPTYAARRVSELTTDTSKRRAAGRGGRRKKYENATLVLSLPKHARAVKQARALCAPNASAESLSIIAKNALPPSKREIAAARQMRWKIFQGHALDPAKLAASVAAVGGIKSAIVQRKLQKVRTRLKLPPQSSFAFHAVRAWLEYFPEQGLSVEDENGAVRGNASIGKEKGTTNGTLSKRKVRTAKRELSASSIAIRPHVKKRGANWVPGAKKKTKRRR